MNDQINYQKEVEDKLSDIINLLKEINNELRGVTDIDEAYDSLEEAKSTRKQAMLNHIDFCKEYGFTDHSINLIKEYINGEK